MIENRLADLGITGNIGRLSLFREASELILDEARRGIKTVVVVGNDRTVRQVIGAVVTARLTLGVIPLGEPNTLAKLFGIPSGARAVDILGRRSLYTIDVGKVNGRYFLSRMRLPESQCSIVCDGKFTLETKRVGALQIKNLGWIDDEAKSVELSNPQDGYLEAVLEAKEEIGFWRRPVWRRSQFVIKRVVIETTGPAPLAAYVDEEKFAQPRFEVSILPRRLRVIVGRERMV